MIERIDEQNLVRVCEKLAESDADMAFIFQNYGAPPLWKREAHFSTLIHIILEQQVSLASALAAFNKLLDKIGDVTPENVLRLSDEELKAAYFSRQKISYVRDLARAISENKLNLTALESLPNDAVKIELKKIKGIGDWTAGIYLLMALMRPDIMPRGDLALHVAWRDLKKLSAKPNSDEFLIVAERWKPYRAVAARLLWHFYLNARKVR